MAEPQQISFELDEGVPKPFLRWAGGKTRLLRHLRPHFPAQFGSYYEPFLGGGAVFFDFGWRATEGALLSDLNDELVTTWVAVRDAPEELHRALESFRGKDDADAYYDVRDAPPPLEPVERAARFLYLNQTAWNGLYRVNRWGRFNVPWGARPFRGIPLSDLRALSRFLRRAEIHCVDFREVLSRPVAGDFVYLDPPYLPLSDTSKFHGYTERRFRLPDLEELAALCADLTDRGVRWIMSNRDTDAVRKLFSDAHVVALTTRRSVAAQNRRDVEPADSPEVILCSPRATILARGEVAA